jgi:hypothetical protein
MTGLDHARRLRRRRVVRFGSALTVAFPAAFCSKLWTWPSWKRPSGTVSLNFTAGDCCYRSEFRGSETAVPTLLRRARGPLFRAAKFPLQRLRLLSLYRTRSSARSAKRS